MLIVVIGKKIKMIYAKKIYSRFSHKIYIKRNLLTNLFASIKIKETNPHVFPSSNKLITKLWFQWCWFHSTWHIIAFHQSKTKSKKKDFKNEICILYRLQKLREFIYNLLICIPELDTRSICSRNITSVFTYFSTCYRWFCF